MLTLVGDGTCNKGCYSLSTGQEGLTISRLQKYQTRDCTGQDAVQMWSCLVIATSHVTVCKQKSLSLFMKESGCLDHRG